METEKSTSINKISKKDGNKITPLTQKIIDDPTKSHLQDNSKNDILKLLIYIYYYEKNVLNVEKGIKFNEKGTYYYILCNNYSPTIFLGCLTTSSSSKLKK